MKTVRRVIGVGLVSALLTIMAFGCNTIRGAGTDIEHGGRAIERAADQTNDAFHR